MPIRLNHLAGFLGVAAAVNLPWYAAIFLREPVFLRHFFWEHNVLRFVQPFDHLQPVWYYAADPARRLAAGDDPAVRARPSSGQRGPGPRRDADAGARLLAAGRPVVRVLLFARRGASCRRTCCRRSRACAWPSATSWPGRAGASVADADWRRGDGGRVLRSGSTRRPVVRRAALADGQSGRGRPTVWRPAGRPCTASRATSTRSPSTRTATT